MSECNVAEYLTCAECRKDGCCAWGPGCGVPKVREFDGYAAQRVGIFFYRGMDKNFVMDDFGVAVSVPPPVKNWPFTGTFNILNPGMA